MLLTRYGYREWMTITVIAAALAAIAIVLLPTVALGLWVAGGIGAVWLAILSFFRDPIRKVPAAPALQTGEAQFLEFLSPADGRVSAVETVEHHESTLGPAVIVRIFLSVLNVHVNRAPCDGEVVSLRYTPGKFLNAQTEESARCNECNLITLRIDSGGVSETIGIRQVSGMIARRIVCAVKVGEQVKRGQKFGMIKFGSTTELILPRPEDVAVLVKKGDKVKGGVTKLATISLLGDRLAMSAE
jgi:phosphatidylserine decarboxylase